MMTDLIARRPNAIVRIPVTAHPSTVPVAEQHLETQRELRGTATERVAEGCAARGSTDSDELGQRPPGTSLFR